jgi:hypothetical protein
MRSRIVTVVAAVALAASIQTNHIFASIQGLTFSVADAFTGDQGVGTHFHAIGGGDGGVAIPLALAEVGGFFGAPHGEGTDEEIRGMSEFDIRGLPGGGSVTLRFDVADLVELELSDQPVGGAYGQEPYVGQLDVFTYTGNNMEDLSDFEDPLISASLLASFGTTGLAAGDTLNFDVSAAVSQLVGLGEASLGIRLQMNPRDTNAGAITFDNFRLDVVPEPAGLVVWGLLGISCLALGLIRRAGPFSVGRRATS